MYMDFFPPILFPKFLPIWWKKPKMHLLFNIMKLSLFTYCHLTCVINTRTGIRGKKNQQILLLKSYVRAYNFTRYILLPN